MIEKAFPASQLWTLSPENHPTRYYIYTGGLIHQKTSATSSFQWAVAPQRSCTPSWGGCRSRLTICQLNQFNTNSEAAMLSNRGPDDWDITEWRLSNGIFSLGQNQGEAGTPTGGSHHSRLVINQIANYNYKTKQLSQRTGKRDWSTGILSSQLLSHRILTENWCNNWSGQFLRNV